MPHILKIKRPPRRTAFTLIELVVAATIFSFVAAAIGASLYSGIKIWNRAKNVDFAKANFLLDLDLMVQELYQCVDIAQIGFEGKAQEFSFPFVSGNSVVKIIYKFNPADKILYKSKIDLKQILADKDDKGKVYPSEKFLSVDDISIAYFSYDKEKKKYVEQDAWTKDKGIFGALELRVTFKNEKFTKKIFIPIS